MPKVGDGISAQHKRMIGPVSQEPMSGIAMQRILSSLEDLDYACDRIFE